MTRPTLGILGGSFDPPHFGHVMLALASISIGGLAAVVVAPTFVHAFGKPLCPFEHRLHMCQLAFQDLHNVEVSAIEAELGGVSRTLRLVAELSRRHPGTELRLVIGSDILRERARWQDFDEICELAPPLVAERIGYEAGAAELGGVFPQVSSSDLRAAIRRGEEPALLPARVRAYIRAENLYADGS